MPCRTLRSPESWRIWKEWMKMIIVHRLFFEFDSNSWIQSYLTWYSNRSTYFTLINMKIRTVTSFVYIRSKNSLEEIKQILENASSFNLKAKKFFEDHGYIVCIRNKYHNVCVMILWWIGSNNKNYNQFFWRLLWKHDRGYPQ